MPDPGLTTKDVLALAIAGTSLLVTIVWNLQNRRHTDRVAKRLRSESFELDEWKSKRAEVLRTLRAFEDVARRLLVLATGAHQKDDLIKQINLEGPNLSFAHKSLIDELKRASDDPDWSPLAYGVTVGGERDWDRLNQVLHDVGQLAEPDAMRTRLKDIEANVQSISRVVGDRIDERNLELRPRVA
jgi:hypothetical protein